MKQNLKHLDCVLLEHLTVAEKMLFVKHVATSEKYYRGKSSIQLHEANLVGLLLDGIAVLSRIDHDGEEVLVKFISRNHIIDYRQMSSHDDRYELDVAKQTTIVWFDRDEFYAYANTNPLISSKITECFVREREFLDQYLTAMSRSLAIDKVLALLRWFASMYDTQQFDLPISYSRISHMIGISRDRFKECLLMLQEQNYIRLSGKYGITMM